MASYNVYHPLSYEGAIGVVLFRLLPNLTLTPTGPDLDNIDDPLQLGTTYGIPEHSHLLLQSNKPIKCACLESIPTEH